MSLILGLLTPTTRPVRTRNSILKYAGGLLGIGLALAWIMYVLPRNPIRF
jgi:CBS-domain-containing membrane protein